MRALNTAASTSVLLVTQRWADIRGPGKNLCPTSLHPAGGALWKGVWREENHSSSDGAICVWRERGERKGESGRKKERRVFEYRMELGP